MQKSEGMPENGRETDQGFWGPMRLSVLLSRVFCAGANTMVKMAQYIMVVAAFCMSGIWTRTPPPPPVPPLQQRNVNDTTARAKWRGSTLLGPNRVQCPVETPTAAGCSTNDFRPQGN